MQTQPNNNTKQHTSTLHTIPAHNTSYTTFNRKHVQKHTQHINDYTSVNISTTQNKHQTHINKINASAQNIQCETIHTQMSTKTQTRHL